MANKVRESYSNPSVEVRHISLIPQVQDALTRDRVIIKALEKNPQDRYQRASELQAELIRVRGEIARRWRRRLAVAALAIVALFAGIGWRLGLLRPGLRTAPIQSIAVLPLANLSADPEQDILRMG